VADRFSPSTARLKLAVDELRDVALKIGDLLAGTRDDAQP